MKRILALLLTAILLMSAACAEGLKPRRDAAEAPAAGSTPAQSALPGPAAPSGAGADDLLAAPEAEETSGLKPRRGEAEATPAEPQPPEQASPASKDASSPGPADEEAEPPAADATPGIDWWPDAEEERDDSSGLKPRHGEEHHAERHEKDAPDPAAGDVAAYSKALEGTFTIDGNGVELSYGFSVEMTTGVEESAFKFIAAPTSGYGMELEGELELPDPMIIMTALSGFGPQRGAPEELLRGTLEARDAFNGTACARYTLTLTGDGVLRGEEALRGERWEVDLCSEEAEAFSGDLSAQWLNGLLDLISRNVFALEEGDPVRLSLREVAMPFVRALYSPDSDATVERLGIDRAMLSRALLEAAAGELRLAPTEEGLSVAWYSEGSPELSRSKIEGTIDADGGEFSIFENSGNGYQTIASVSADLAGGLRVHVDEYRNGGYLYFDAGNGIFRNTFDASLAFAYSKYDPPLMAFLDYDGREARDDGEQTLRLRVVEYGHMLTCTLNFACSDASGRD